MKSTQTLETIARSAKAHQISALNHLLAMSETPEEEATMRLSIAKIEAMSDREFLKYKGVA